MKLSWNSITILLFSILIINIVSADIIWDQDLIFDPNTNTGPLASCVNEKANGIYVITKTEPKGTFLDQEGECALWEIGVNGNIVHQFLLKDANGNRIRTNAQNVGSGGAMAGDNYGNLVTAGVLGEQRKKRSLDVVMKTEINATDPNIMSGNRIGQFSIKKMMSYLLNDSFVLIGDKLNDGFYLRIDNQGKITKEVQFDMGRTEKFTGVAQLKPDNLNLAVVGLSSGSSAKGSREKIVENFILIYDPNDTLIYEDYFTGTFPGLTFPKVCCLENSNIVVTFYNKLKDDSAAGFTGSDSRTPRPCFRPETVNKA